MALKKRREIAKEPTAGCVSCGILVADDGRVQVDGKNYCVNCAILARKNEPVLAVPSGFVKWLCYAVSFLSPFAGFVLGIVFRSQKDAGSRSFGNRCLIIMTVSILLILIFLVLSAAAGLLEAGGSYQGLNISEGYY